MTTVHDIEVRLARSPDEVDAAQRLRYRVFFEEWGAHPGPHIRQTQRDVDGFDAAMDHLIVIDHSRPRADGQVVGNYRLQRGAGFDARRRFYSSGEFDIGKLLGSDQRLLELGRSCVLREYRSQPILQQLWRAITAYVAEHGIDVMFGCASLRGTDPHALREQLAYLHHYHLAPAEMRPRASGPNRIGMDVMDKACIDVPRARFALEPLIKGYLRQGAWVGEGAYIDHQFNSVDICIVMPTAHLTRKLLRHYKQALQARWVEGDMVDGLAGELPAKARDSRWVAAG